MKSFIKKLLRIHGIKFCDVKNKNVNLKALDILATNSQAEPPRPVMFIHIPKTAGTSFRDAAIKSIGNSSVAKNYGEGSEASTSWVVDYVFERNDYPGLYHRLIKDNYLLYIGHMNANPAALVFPIKQVATIIRHPVERVVSNYNHFYLHKGYQKSVVEFIKSKQFVNMQSRTLWPLPVSLIGFIGIAEAYNNSLDIFNHMYGYQLEVLQSNVNTAKAIEAPDEGIVDLIKLHNDADIRLYDYVRHQHRRRLALEQQGKAWCFGAVRQRTINNIIGYACWYHNKDVVVVQLVNRIGKVLQEVEASQHRPGLCQFNPPRNGFIGFNFKLSDLDNNDVTVIVKTSGQELVDEF